MVPRPWEEVPAEVDALVKSLSSPWVPRRNLGAVAEAHGAGAPPTTPSGRGAAPEAPGLAASTSADAAPRQVAPVLPCLQGVRRDLPPLSPPPGSTSAAGRSAASPAPRTPPTPEPFAGLHEASPSTEAPKPTAFQAKWLQRLQQALSWTDFEAALADLTSELEPPKPALQRRGPPPQSRRALDPPCLQKLYRTNLTKAMRLVREEESPLCDVPAEAVADYFEDVFSDRLPSLSAPPSSAVLPTTQAHDASLFSPLTCEEIVARLKHCSDTVPGPDGIRYSIMKRRDPSALLTQTILNRCLNEGNIPSSWRGARTGHGRADLCEVAPAVPG
ncbi:Methyltransferase-like protein 25 [Frankliniella fusca]|uniref:Methyltransferase-like protein 25 n=1 Tax=Frankliniella fusca TaxID=407009 RepID=A0AAE1LL67_9NEOP|nr:Methyltransferase-like protein 25 [Frankliniella fusca]